MDSRTIQLTPAAHKHGNLNIRSCGKDFFPSDVFGNSSRSKGIGTPITLKIEGLGKPIKTDIPTDKSTGRPRWIFRERKWLKEFVSHYNLKTNDLITISRIDNRIYTISPQNNHLPQKESTQMTTGTYTIKTKKKPAQKKCDKVEATIATPPQGKLLDIGYTRKCTCRPNNINCLTAKEWLKCQLGVWQFNYEARDIRDKKLHPAAFPISLARKVIELFSHRGELVLDPFVGSGTTLIAAQDADRNAVGFDLQKNYIQLANKRIDTNKNMYGDTKQLSICEDARNIPDYFPNESISLILTSPPYANLLNRKRLNKSRRNRNNDQLGKIEQYSQDPRDLGTMELSDYTKEMGDIFEGLLPLLRPKGHCVINVPDMWWDNKRITIHVSLIEELRGRGYELRNIIIWDRTNIVNEIGIFGWPSNYITMGVTFEYLLDFWKPPKKNNIEGH
jgi:DNA modification methylase